MSTLTLCLAGPLQSWGAASRFTRRGTEAVPTKSGILGLLASASGRRRSDPIEDLLGLSLAVRTDQTGALLRDFHTAHHQITGDSMPLTQRYYWTDAVFVAFVGGPAPLLEGLDEALRDPRFPLYLGRRSCVPAGRVSLGVHDDAVAERVASCPWQGGLIARRQASGQAAVTLPVQADSEVFPDEPPSRELNDVPVSWAQEHRQYRTRMVVNTHVTIATGLPTATGPHDPMAFLEGAAS